MTINKVSDKLAKVSEDFAVCLYDNGYMLAVSGQDDNGDYKSAKIIVSTVEDLIALVKEVTSLPRAD